MEEIYNEKIPWINILSAWSGWLIDGFVSLTYVLTIVSNPAILSIFFPNSAFLGLGFLFSTLGFALSGGIARFVGSAIMGNFIGDKIGRRTMLIISVPIFSFANFLIFFVPGFSLIGYLSPIIIYVIAFIVGFFAGAEYGGGTALSLESVPARKRLWVGAFVQSGFGMGFVLIALVSFFLSNSMSPGYYVSYGFRYLFLLSIIPGVISLFLRYNSTETEVFSDMVKKKGTVKVPLLSMIFSKGSDSFKQFLILIIIIGGLLTVNTATFSFYANVLIHDNFAAGFAKYIFIYIMIINAISIVGVFFGAFISSVLVLRKRSIFILSLVFLIITIPVEIFAISSNPYLTVTALSVQAFFEAAIFSVIPIFLAEKFSKKFRTTGIGIIYNVGSTIGALGLTYIAIADVFFKNFVGSWLIVTVIGAIVLLIGTAMTRETLTEIDLDKKNIIDPITQ